jgi:UDP-2,4-diacetamido-2,4,6-trideoxy-beta-L-altropyranose hydrolase
MKIAFRADASFQIGTGHVMRCLALADALAALGAECHFICRAHDGHLSETIGERGHKAHMLPSPATQPSDDETALPYAAWLGCGWQEDARQTRALLDGLQPEWLVVDHYALDAKWESAVKPDAVRLLVIDDLADRTHAGDALLNQNLGAEAADYTGLVPAKTRLLIGPRFALLRPEFAARRDSLSATGRGPKNNWLACVGGTDPHDVLGKIIEAWKMMQQPRPPLDIAVRADSPNVPALKQSLAGVRGATLHTHATDLVELMARADLLIGTTGSISWERCCLGLPSVMGTVAENQRKNLDELAWHRTGIGVGAWQDVVPKNLAALFDKIKRHPRLLQAMGQRSMRLVDGKGACRVAVTLLLDRLQLRPAARDDALLALEWRNEESTRRYSFDSSPLVPEKHFEWWQSSINSPTRDLLIAEIGKLSVGVLRLDRAEAEAAVSVYADPALTGLGLGAAILEAGLSWCRRARPETKRLVAEILPENKASRAAFGKAGFVQYADQWIAEV